jgi:hypothetical protein
MDSAILHLAPNSTDAKVFEGFSNSTKGSSTPIASGNKFNSCLYSFFFFPLDLYKDLEWVWPCDFVSQIPVSKQNCGKCLI